MKPQYLGFFLVAALLLLSIACAGEKANDDKAKEEAVPELKEETTLIVKLSYFTIKLYGFMPAEEGTPEGYEGMVTDRSELVEDVTVNYELWDYMGMYGSPFNAHLRIVPGEKDFQIVRIDQKYTTTLFANIDGMGAAWPMDKVEASISEWMEIEKLGEYAYRTLKQKELDIKKPPISEESYKNAEELCKDAQPPMEYFEYTLNTKIRLTWTAPDEDTLFVLLNFDYIYGD